MGTVTHTPWDPQLAVLMNARDTAIHEEALLSTLLADLES
jgi:hypothetical protein